MAAHGRSPTDLGIDDVQTFDGHLVHFVGDRMFAIACKAINAGPHNEVRTKCVRLAIEFVDIAFPVTDVNAAIRRRNERR